MSYIIDIEPVKEELRKLDKQIQKEFYKKIKKLEQHPTLYGKSLH